MASTFRIINRGQVMPPFQFSAIEDTLTLSTNNLREMSVDIFSDATVEIRETAGGPMFVLPVNTPWTLKVPPAGITLRITGANGSPGIMYGRVQ